MLTGGEGGQIFDLFKRRDFMDGSLKRCAKIFQRLKYNKVCSSNKKPENKLHFLRLTNRFFIISRSKKINDKFFKLTLTILEKQ